MMDQRHPMFRPVRERVILSVYRLYIGWDICAFIYFALSDPYDPYPTPTDLGLFVLSVTMFALLIWGGDRDWVQFVAGSMIAPLAYGRFALMFLEGFLPKT